jgi:carbon-monoxide dehydrogenase large subunit
VAGTDRSVDLFAVAGEIGPGGLAAERHHENQAVTYPNGCHVCEVEIDPETGAVDVVAFTAIDDVGRAINPMIVSGQSQGGIAQGIGQALLEHGLYDRETGQLITGSFLDYALPRADDLPPLEPMRNDVPSPTNPLGVKGAGEGGTTGAPAAVMNAIMDALAPLGVGHLDMPATPAAIWTAIQAARK